ncbi:MAG: HPF/RaiA family ribosome-associated protein [Acidimicrobiia bacterium]|nr:HPF/RaiA family ribosome-associated protein [Acidimicrobiia bacterium]
MDGPEPSVSTHGKVPHGAVDYAKRKVEALYRAAPRPVVHAAIRLEREMKAGLERPATTEVSLDISGRNVRAKVAAPTLHESIDLVEDRLRRQLKRLAEISITKGRRPKVRADGEWRHGDEPMHRPLWRERSAEDRQIVRRKTFAVGEMSPDEAVFEMEQLDHDFFLFVNLDTHEDNVVERLDDGTYMLAALRTRDPELDGCVAPIKAAATMPAELDTDEAVELLDVENVNFVFYLDTDSGRGHVLYRRFDGNYGLIVPG